MSRTERHLDCTAQQLFDVLADGWEYSAWVVGAARIRSVDRDWPAPGSLIHHSVGLWPLLINDTTEVLEYDPPHRLRLSARGWPAGVAEVTITAQDDPDGGCTAVIEEDATSGPATLVPKPVRDAMLHLRNVEALRRLEFRARRSTG